MNGSNASAAFPVPGGPDPGRDPKALVARGWLAGQSVFDPPPKRRLGGAFGASFVLHGLILVLVVFVIGLEPAQNLLNQVAPELKYVFLQDPGPGGGGGGSPAPAPPKKMEIPKTKPPEPVPVPVVTPPPVPQPTLVAPIETNMASVLQSTGLSSVSMAAYGGGGQGTGVGSGKGPGVGPGTGGGFGGGAMRPGAGISGPTVLRKVEPKYTSEAMRAKIQGIAELEVVVLADGKVGDIRVIKSLDKTFGLDEEAKIAAKGWEFRPARDRDGKPVPVIVILELEFRIH
jgi:TonB family protein